MGSPSRGEPVETRQNDILSSLVATQRASEQDRFGTSLGSQSAAGGSLSSGGTYGTGSRFSETGTTGPAAGALGDYLARAQQLSTQPYAAGPSALQQMTFDQFPQLYSQARGGYDQLQRFASGEAQNQALRDDVRRRLDLQGTNYLSGLLRDRSGLSNTGAQQALGLAQRDLINDAYSREYQANQARQLAAAQAMPGYLGQLTGIATGLGGLQRDIAQERLRDPLQGLGVLGQALALGGARFGMGTGDVSSQLGSQYGSAQDWRDALSRGETFDRMRGVDTGTVQTDSRQDTTRIEPGAPQQSGLGTLLGLAGLLGGAALGNPAIGAPIGAAIGQWLDPPTVRRGGVRPGGSLGLM